jgi:ubiquinone biosynthesis protein
MNAIQFSRLIWELYGARGRLPDLDWIEKQGLLAIKIGQMHALRIDFLDRERCMHLCRLYRRNKILDSGRFERLVLDALAPDSRDAFDSIESIPLASASIGQVHRAALLDGSPVVIKLVKRNVTVNFAREVQKLRRLLKVVTRLYPALKRAGDPVGILDDLETFTMSELDLRHELQGQQVLKEIQRAQGKRFDLTSLRFPRVYSELSNASVMVSEYVEGETVDELLESNRLEYDQLLDLFRLHGFFLFCVGTFHGDLHPGNVILRDNQWTMVDTGFVGKVSERLRLGLFYFFKALSQYDYPACARALHQMSDVQIKHNDYAEFERRLLDLYADFTDRTVSEISLTRQMMSTIKLGVHHGMHFERGIFSVIRSLMYMDGMVLRCQPNAVLMKDMRPFIQEALGVLPDGKSWSDLERQRR